MKKSMLLATTAVTGVALAASVAAPAYAWHPEGKITKYVTNVTDNGKMSDANTSKDAVSAKPGDTLKYTIVIANTADNAKDNYNDLAFVKMTDSLPAGVELVSDASKRAISEDLGTILPGKSVTKEYTVKVTAKTGMNIENKACFTGDSKVKDNPKQGCDTANVKVTVPPTPVTPPTTPTPTPTPETPAPAPEAPATLPETGAGSVIAMASVVAVAGYAANMLRLRFAGRRA